MTKEGFRWSRTIEKSNSYFPIVIKHSPRVYEQGILDWYGHISQKVWVVEGYDNYNDRFFTVRFKTRLSALKYADSIIKRNKKFGYKKY